MPEPVGLIRPVVWPNYFVAFTIYTFLSTMGSSLAILMFLTASFSLGSFFFVPGTGLAFF